MNRRLIFPLVFGIVGTAILMSLGFWQLQRMNWKAGILAEIDVRLTEAPIELPADIDETESKYLQVKASGNIEDNELHVLTTGEGGPGFRVISPMILKDGRRILVDRGFLPEAQKNADRIGGEVSAVGSLVWPQETDKYVPEPNIEQNIWFARNVQVMAAELDTEQIMLAIRQSDNNEGITPQRVSINISNRHLEYVMTWFSLAAIWIGMTVYSVWRIKRKTP